MTAADNLRHADTRPNWYAIAPLVESAMRAEAEKSAIRFRAGWEHDDYGWWGPDPDKAGDLIHESLWEDQTGLPFPENVK